MNAEQAIEDACQSFQSFAVAEMIYDWIRNSQHPQMLINLLINGWKKRMTDMMDARAHAAFQQTGVISTDRGPLEQIIAEAERRIRLSFDKMLADSKEVDELAARHLAHSGVQ